MAELLLIDDMAGVRRAVAAMLKRAGHTVTIAGTGGEGLSLLEDRHFDLVVTDMLMPDMDGADILFHVSQRPTRPPVIAISGGGAGVSAETALRTARISADAFLEKPFDAQELLEMIDRLLGKARSPS